MSKIRAYYTDTVDRAAKTAAQSALLTIGADQINALHADWQLVGGMALGGAVLSLLTTLAQRGLFGRE
ncbi:holin [Nocardioides jensenii]|uniref:holin n=1 Tax=Nocardioides jensenii TaxID=1843 RepID=UPI00082FB4AB|nr:holin [Nocardioides jensenii]